jgi:hypothetical protein
VQRCCRMRAAASAVSLVLSMALQPVPGHALERVIIEGERERGEDWAGFDYGPGGVGGGPTGGGEAPIGGDSIDVAGVNPTKDVRCWKGAQSTTSQAIGEYRHGIAMSMYRALVAAGRSQQVGSWFTVTWADGGSTSYQVAQNGAGALLAWGNERETPGDGVVRSGPVCGEG